MAFYDNIGSKIARGFKRLFGRCRNAFTGSSMKRKIRAAQKDEAKAYEALGKAFFELYPNTMDAGLAESLAAIRDAKQRIADFSAKMEASQQKLLDSETMMAEQAAQQKAAADEKRRIKAEKAEARRQEKEAEKERVRLEKEEEAQRAQAAEEQRKIEEAEAQKKAEEQRLAEEAARQQAEEEARIIEAETKKAAEAAEARRIAEEEAARKAAEEAEARRIAEEEAAKKAAEEEAIGMEAEAEKKVYEAEEARLAEEEAAKKAAEEEALKAEDEAGEKTSPFSWDEYKDHLNSGTDGSTADSGSTDPAPADSSAEPVKDEAASENAEEGSGAFGFTMPEEEKENGFFKSRLETEKTKIDKLSENGEDPYSWEIRPSDEDNDY